MVNKRESMLGLGAKTEVMSIFQVFAMTAKGHSYSDQLIIHSSFLGGSILAVKMSATAS